MSSDPYKHQSAIQDFQSARQRAAIQEVLARVRGKSNQLLSYEDVAEKLKLRVRTERGIQHIPLDAIVGSVGRYNDFTRTFLPRRTDDQERWVGVKSAFIEGNLPPIEVYKVGDVYFVVDGNHRVSIARQEKFETIEARVIEFQTDIPLTPDVQPDDLIIKAEYVEFLQTTRLNETRLNLDLNVTVPGQYDILMSQIHLQRFIIVEDQKREISLQDAAAYWYDTIYIPLAEAIRDRDLLHWFPGRTVTDLYLWISENRSALEKELGWQTGSDIAATDLILERGVKSEPGSWRKARTVARYLETLFADILVPLNGSEEGWDALDQAIIIAQREKARLHGLHIVPTREDTESSDALDVKAHFEQTCKDANVEGKLAVDVGDVTKRIFERAVLTDLIVLKITYPPGKGISALQSPFRTILTEASRPLLTVPAGASQFKHALLAYDGSDQSKEALFVATYLAEMWKTELLVFTAAEGAKSTSDIQDHVRRYLEFHEVEAEYIVGEQKVTEHLKTIVEQRNVDVVLMGSHGGSMLQQVFIGSALDHMLRESNVPTFICR